MIVTQVEKNIWKIVYFDHNRVWEYRFCTQLLFRIAVVFRDVFLYTTAI